MTVQLSPLAFSVNKLVDIHDAQRRLEAESEAFSELQAVLKKHGLEKKYGITLLHKHFDLNDDEIMVEYTDMTNRTLISKPEKLGTVPSENMVEVTWSLEDDTTMNLCVWRCYFNPNSTPQHVGQHAAG